MHILLHGELLQNKQYGAVRRGGLNIIIDFLDIVHHPVADGGRVKFLKRCFEQKHDYG
jgi:hypothetical protein